MEKKEISKQKLEYNVKKSTSVIIPYLIVVSLISIILAISSYVFSQTYDLTNLIILISSSIVLFIILIFFILYLLIPSYLIKYDISKEIDFNERYIVVYKSFRRIKIYFKDIFSVYSSSYTYQVLGNSKVLIYLNNGKIITIKYIKYAKELYNLINNNILNKNYLIDKEPKVIKSIKRFIEIFINLALRLMKIYKSTPFKTYEELINIYKMNKITKVFIVISNTVYKLNYHQKLISILESNNISYFIYNISVSNPNIEEVNKAYEVYLKSKMNSLLAIGGGSIIDLTKALGILISQKNKDLSRCVGKFKVKKKLPFLVTIPTILGSGSETTSTSVVSFDDGKYPITSFKLVPSYTYFGEDFISNTSLKTLEVHILDAFTHAIEAYLNVYSIKRFDEYALKAMKLIATSFNKLLINNINLNDENNLSMIRESFIEASYLAGIAFSYKGVGAIHALSHPLSFKYGLGHAKTNATLTPYVLKTYKYNKRAYKKMTYLAKYLDLGSTPDDLILFLENINKYLDIPNFIKEIKPDDIKYMAIHAKSETGIFYGTPIYYSLDEFIMMYINIKSK